MLFPDTPGFPLPLHIAVKLSEPLRIFLLHSGQTFPKNRFRRLYMKVTLDQMLDSRGVSQNQLAKDTGISTSTLRNLNHNRTTRISFDVLEKICLYLNCGVGDILCLEMAD
jgi:putative transcriptional regulator